MNDNTEISIYKIGFQEGYRSYSIVDSEGVTFSGVSTSLKVGNQKLRCRTLGKSKPIANISALGLAGFVLSEEMMDLFIYSLGYSAQYFELNISSNQVVYGANVTKIFNALDRVNSKIEKDADGGPMIDKYCFHTVRMNDGVFKIPETADRELFTISYEFSSVEDDFYKTYQANQLTGLTFEEVY